MYIILYYIYNYTNKHVYKKPVKNKHTDKAEVSVLIISTRF